MEIVKYLVLKALSYVPLFFIHIFLLFYVILPQFDVLYWRPSHRLLCQHSHEVKVSFVKPIVSIPSVRWQ